MHNGVLRLGGGGVVSNKKMKALTARLDEMEAVLLDKMIARIREVYPKTSKTDYIKGLIFLDAYHSGLRVPEMGIQIPAWANAKMFSDTKIRHKGLADPLREKEAKKKWAK